MHIVQALSDEDYASRLYFAEEKLWRIAENPQHLDFLAFSHKAHFHQDGAVNRHNHR